MLDPYLFYQELQKAHVGFFTGVPDSLMREFCACLLCECPEKQHIIAANEGNALALATGYYLASGKIPLVYLQNSGLGNILNPLLSLCHASVYAIPAVLMIGWRGEKGIKDEPQHMQQGAATLKILKSLKIRYSIISPKTQDTAIPKLLNKTLYHIHKTQSPYALVIRRASFSRYHKNSRSHDLSALSRERALSLILDHITQHITHKAIISTTGHISRELSQIAQKKSLTTPYFMNIGAMGHVSQIALGLSLHSPKTETFCFDGDGSLIMHMGGMAVVAIHGQRNYHHILFNNGVHGSVGGQPTIGNSIDLSLVAKSMGYRQTFRVDTEKTLIEHLSTHPFREGPNFLEILVSAKAPSQLGRPQESPKSHKAQFIKELRLNTEKDHALPQA